MFFPDFIPFHQSYLLLFLAHTQEAAQYVLLLRHTKLNRTRKTII